MKCNIISKYKYHSFSYMIKCPELIDSDRNTQAFALLLEVHILWVSSAHSDIPGRFMTQE